MRIGGKKIYNGVKGGVVDKREREVTVDFYKVGIEKIMIPPPHHLF